MRRHSFHLAIRSDRAIKRFGFVAEAELDRLSLEADVFVGPNATFTNDLRPRSKQYLPAPLETVVESGASIGANATILPGIRIGEKGKRVGKQAEDNLKENEAEVQADSQQEGAAEILRRPMLMTMFVMRVAHI